MSLQTKEDLLANSKINKDHSKITDSIFSKDYVDFLNDAGWRLEKKLPSNNNNYSDLPKALIDIMKKNNLYESI